MGRVTVYGSVALGAAAALMLCACAPDDPAAADASSGVVRVVTSTDVYADIVRSIGGDDVEVKALISSDSGADPHSYEATARDQLAVRNAQLVIANGGGYDDFLTQALDAAGRDRKVLTAVTEAHHEDEGAAAATSSPAPHDHGDGSNEHVWYDLEAMSALATATATALGDLRPAERSDFTSRARTFQAGLTELMDRQDHIRAEHNGTAVAITEPVPLYLLADCGLVNRTPQGFSEAIEEGTDVPVRVLQETLDLFTGHAVDLLVYNSQTTGPQTERVSAAAEHAGIPVVPMSETLPSGQSYLAWMGANLDAVEAALTGPGS
jgi:zinc/manganese transport system substrate-binding protein